MTTRRDAQAVMASDCKKKLIELEPRFAGASPASVGILLAIAGVLLARRLK